MTTSNTSTSATNRLEDVILLLTQNQTILTTHQTELSLKLDSILVHLTSLITNPSPPPPPPPPTHFNPFPEISNVHSSFVTRPPPSKQSIIPLGDVANTFSTFTNRDSPPRVLDHSECAFSAFKNRSDTHPDPFVGSDSCTFLIRHWPPSNMHERRSKDRGFNDDDNFEFDRRYPLLFPHSDDAATPVADVPIINIRPYDPGPLEPPERWFTTAIVFTSFVMVLRVPRVSSFGFDPGGTTLAVAFPVVHRLLHQRLQRSLSSLELSFSTSHRVSDPGWPSPLLSVAPPSRAFPSSARSSTSSTTVPFPAMATSSGAASCWPWVPWSMEPQIWLRVLQRNWAWQGLDILLRENAGALCLLGLIGFVTNLGLPTVWASFLLKDICWSGLGPNLGLVMGWALFLMLTLLIFMTHFALCLLWLLGFVPNLGRATATGYWAYTANFFWKNRSGENWEALKKFYNLEDKVGLDGIWNDRVWAEVIGPFTTNKHMPKYLNDNTRIF